MELSDDAARGRTLLLGLIVLILLSDAVVSLLYLNQMPAALSSPKGQMALATRAVRFMLTVLLMLMVYRGSVVAKWITVVLFGVSALVMIPMVLIAPIFSPLLLIFVGIFYALVFSPDVRQFLEDQRSRRRSPGDQFIEPAS